LRLVESSLVSRPGFRREAMHGLIGLGGQAGEEVRQVGLGVDAFTMAVAKYPSNEAP